MVRKWMSCLLMFCVHLQCDGGDKEISDFLRNFSDIASTDTIQNDSAIKEFGETFIELLRDQKEILQADTLICEVIRSSSMLISNSVKTYLFSGYGDTLSVSDTPSKVCPHSATLLKILCKELDDYVSSIITKPVCKGDLNPLEYAVKLHNVDAVRMLLQHNAHDICSQSHDHCKRLLHLAATKQDDSLLDLLISSNLSLDNDAICDAYSNTYYICALGLGCEIHKLIEASTDPLLAGIEHCTLKEPDSVISELLSHQSFHNDYDVVYSEGRFTGGWFRHSEDMTDGPCEIPIVSIDRLSKNDLKILEYMSIPILIKGGLEGSVLFEEWSRDKLQEKYGYLEVIGGPIPYGEVFGELSGVSTINEFLQYMSRYNENYGKASDLPLYIFDVQVIPEHFASLVSIPDMLHISNATLIYQFILGPRGSGAPFHFHCNAVNSLVFGRKKWYLYPPGKGYYSKTHPLNWKHDGKQLECVQHAGDIVYVPSGWSHSTLNIDDCIGHAIEFDTNDC